MKSSVTIYLCLGDSKDNKHPEKERVIYMVKSLNIRRLFLLLITSLLIISQLNLTSFQAFAEERNEEPLSYEVQKELSADKKSAKLKIKATPSNEEVKIVSIETPDKQITEGQEAEFTAEKNGPIDFIITYQEKQDGQYQENKTFKATYEVSEILVDENKTDVNKNLLKSSESNVTLEIPDYDGSAWKNGEIKEVNVTASFDDNTSGQKKLNFTLPDGMRFVSIPVPSNYSATNDVDTGVLNYLNTGDPLGSAISSVSVPSKESTYGKATYGTVSYTLEPGTEKVSFSFSVRVDAAKYYGTTDIKSPIKVETFEGDESTPVDSAQQAIHAEGRNVVGAAEQSHVETMFRNWYSTATLSSVTASTDTEDSFNYTKCYSVVNSIVQEDGRGSKSFVPKHVSVTLYYPEGMEYVGVVNESKSLLENTADRTITPYPEENKVVIDCNQQNFPSSPGTIYAVKYKVPKGTKAGTYTTNKVPHAVITTYDNNVFETDALTNNASDMTTLAEKDTCTVVEETENIMSVLPRNHYINPDNESWGGHVQINNKNSAGVKKNQMYQIKFDENWEAYTVNLPCDGTLSGNKVTDVQYKTNLNSTYRTYEGSLPKTNANKMVTMTAAGIGLQPGEYFTEVKGNVGDFSVGYTNIDPTAAFTSTSSLSYGIVKPGIKTVDFNVNVWDAGDEENTKVNGVSTYIVSNNVSSAVDGSASFYNQEGTKVKTAKAGDTLTTKASLVLHGYPFGTRTVLNDPEIYLRQIEGAKIKPGSIKLYNQDGEEVDFSVEEKSALNGDKVYVLKTTDATVGEYVGNPAKKQYLNIEYDTVFDVTLDKSIQTDIQKMLAWGGSNVYSAISANSFSDNGLDVNQNGKDREYLLSTKASMLSVSKQDTVSVETFLSVADEGTKAAYVDGDESTVSYFTPGTEADYMVKVTNSSSASTSALDVFVPIPKTGQNFGSKFQSEAFKWDMKLNGAVPLTDEQKAQLEISYATEANADNYESESVYSSSPSSYEKVNMVRIRVKTQIDSGESQTIKVPLKVDETFNSATEGDKISERNVYNPHYRVTTNTYSGALSGTKVGAELVILEAGGFLFQDKDANGLYEKDQGDTALANETVELYKWNESTSAYEPFLKDGDPVTVKTNADGKYTFNYNVGLAYGKYAVKFPDRAGNQFTLKKVGQDNTINSTVPNTGTDKGWVKEINPEQPTSQNINAGYMEYAPANDLKVNLSDKTLQAGKSLKVTLPKVEATSGEAAENTIEPSFFHNIQAPSNGYKWTSKDASVATVDTASDGSGIIVGVSTGDKAIATTDLSITIKDIFGTEKKSTAPVYITNSKAVVDQKGPITLGAMDFTLEHKEAIDLSETEATNLAKAVAFEEIKTGVLSSAQDSTDSLQVDENQLKAIQEASNLGGTYPLTYQVTKDGQTAEVIIQVTVEKDLTVINVHDSILYVGDAWTASDNFDSALDKTGEILPFAAIQVAGSVDTTTAGIYSVNYSYQGMTKTAKIEVKDNLTEVNAHDSIIYTNDTWSAADNFDSALNKTGNALSLSDLTVTGTVNTKQAGTYTVTYKYENVEKTITVTVKENKKGVNGHNSTIYVGDSWTAEDNFDNAVDKDGNPVAFADVKVKEDPSVNIHQAGTYQITYSYDGVSTTVTLTVKEIKTAINAHDSILYINDNWNAADNFDSARDKDGNSVSFDDVQVTGSVDTTQAGTYTITYAYDGLTKTIQVTVKNPQTAIQAHDSVIYAGDKWQAKDNFDKAIDKAGKDVEWKNITVNTNVDTTKPGVYTVTYSYDGISSTINVTVKPLQTTVKVHDSSFYAGSNWNAKDNFDQATNKDGEKIDFQDITVTGSVNSNTPGTYEISYLYDGVKAIARVTVLKNYATLIVKDSVLTTGDTWNAQDNFIKALDRDGRAISFDQVKVEGNVNLNKAGKYQVTYSIDPNEGTKDAGKQVLSVTATIQVEEVKQANAQGNSSLTIKDNTQHMVTSDDIKLIPKTGDQGNPWVFWAGISLVGLGLVLLMFLQRRRNSN